MYKDETNILINSTSLLLIKFVDYTQFYGPISF